MYYLEVLIEDVFLNNQTLTYSTNDSTIRAGMRVVVPLRGRRIVAFVMKTAKPYTTAFKVQPIIERLDREPIIDERLMNLAKWMAYETVSPLIRCLQTLLPNKLKPKSSAKKAKQIKYYYHTGKEIEVDNSLTEKQKTCLKTMAAKDYWRANEVKELYSNFRSLLSLGYLATTMMEAEYEPEIIDKTFSKQVLTAKQKDVISQVNIDAFNTYLLHGVTGSGKTEVYLNIAELVLAMNRQVLILVPEISLTPQMIDRVSHRFGTDVAIYHSGLNDQEKYEQYIRVKKHEVHVIVGTRSAIFMPFDSLGLIVMDEEHDTSYKQDSVPMYHTRDVATYCARTFNCPLILGSASPALESYARALKNRYILLELEQRINDVFPKVTVINTRDAVRKGSSMIVTDIMKKGIENRLNKYEQTILLLNRRGYLPLLKNSKTNEVLQCQYCDIALNYHKSDNSVRCHMCGEVYYSLPVIDGERVSVTGSGVGTERLVEYLKQLYPQARIARMDADTTQKKGAHAQILNDFAQHKYDILVGTQMIAKGLDIENVTLMGVINADAGLANSDYRSVEHTFDLLLQAAGRSGRGKYPGEVMIQTENPDHYAIQCAMHQKYKHFFKQEMAYRKIANYPPYSYLIACVIQDVDDAIAQEAMDLFFMISNEIDVRKIGPTPLRKLHNKYRYRLILKGSNLNELIKQTNKIVEEFKNKKGVNIVIDVNPMSLE